jgi:hypothetical protein
MAGRLSMASVFAVALAALFATPAIAADGAHTDDVCTVPSAGPEAQRDAAGTATPLEASIAAIFAAATEEGTTDGPSLQLMVARVKDGKPVMACVDSKEAATRFLAAPIAKIRAKAAEEK